MARRLASLRATLDRQGVALDALSPLAVLARGFAMPRGADGQVLRKVADFTPGARFTLRVSDGQVTARAEET